MLKARSRLAALMLVGLLAQATPAFADAVFTTSGHAGGMAALTYRVSYGPVFDSKTLVGNVILSRVNNNGSRTEVGISQLGLDAADPTRRTLTVVSHITDSSGTYELRIKPGALKVTEISRVPSASRN